jgi:RNA polymerase sigma-70 factor (family 1)
MIKYFHLESIMGSDFNDIDNQQRIQFASVFNQFENRLFLFALKITKSEASARDIVQEVFLKLWEQKDAFDRIENTEAYLFRATKNKAIDFLRVLANDDKLRTGYFSSFILEEDNTEKEINRREFNKLLGTAIKNLPAQRSLIYQMSQVEGYSRKEIAEKMSLSESTVKNQLTSAISSVRNFIKKNMKSLFSFF